MAFSSGMTLPISLVCLCSSLLPAAGRVQTFLSVAGLGLMTDGAHNVGLTALLINRVFLRFPSIARLLSSCPCALCSEKLLPMAHAALRLSTMGDGIFLFLAMES
jgi:hypothetical protein